VATHSSPSKSRCVSLPPSPGHVLTAASVHFCLLLLQLWATVGFAFNVSVACTSVSSRIKKSYDILLEPLDQVMRLRQRPTSSNAAKSCALVLQLIIAREYRDFCHTCVWQLQQLTARPCPLCAVTMLDASQC
jgi:hypothetical protein